MKRALIVVMETLLPAQASQTSTVQSPVLKRILLRCFLRKFEGIKYIDT